MTYQSIRQTSSLPTPKSDHEGVAKKRINVLLVDDSEFVLQGLIQLLDTVSDIEIVGTALNGQLAIQQVTQLQPDVVIMDLQMPEMTGIEAIHQLSKCCPKCQILILSSDNHWQSLSDAIQAGAKGYLLKGASEDEIADAIRMVDQGQSHIQPKLLLEMRPHQADSTALNQESDKTQKADKVSNERPLDLSPSAFPMVSGHKNSLVSLLRPKARESALSPEHLDQVTQAVNPRIWLPILTVGLLTVATGIWSVFGKLPIVVEGQGILIRPRQVVPIQSSATGLLLNLKIKPGDRIQKGDVLGTIDQSELEQKLKQEQNKLAELISQTQDTTILQKQTIDQRRQSLTKQRFSLENKLRNMEAITDPLHQKTQKAIAHNQHSLEQKQLQLQRMLPTLQDRLISRQNIYEKGAISKEMVLQAEREYLEEKSKLLEIESQLEQVKLEDTEAQQQYFDNLNQMTDLKASIEEIDAQSAQLSQTEKEQTIEENNQAQTLRRNIAQLQLQLSNRTDILSEYTGRIVEVGITPGRQIDSGGRLGAIEIEDQNSPIRSLTYFAIRDGKKIQAGMPLQITPTTVKREQFGGIVGTVTDVSQFPVSTQEIETMIGNSDLAQSLSSRFTESGEGAPVQILANLQPDSQTVSGYQWSSSSGPAVTLSAGTTTQVRVKIEERTPISYIIPLLRSWTGIQS